MDHKSRDFRFKKRAGTGKSLPKLLLYVEGAVTEKSYFDLLKRSNCKVVPVIKKGGGINSCVDFVNESYNAWKSLPPKESAKYDGEWLVFDADGRPDFDEGIGLARGKGFGVAFSNMCIEYWFMLHFYEHDGSGIPLLGDSHSAAQIKEINKFIKKYNKKAKSPVPEYDSDSKKVVEDFFDLLMAIDRKTGKHRIVTAFERAKAIHEAKKEERKESAESVTTIYELLLRLGVIEKTDNGFELYEKRPNKLQGKQLCKGVGAL